MSAATAYWLIGAFIAICCIAAAAAALMQALYDNQRRR